MHPTYVNKKMIRKDRTGYLPTYVHAPVKSMDYAQIVKLAIERFEFHKKLEEENKTKVLSYDDIRTLSYQYGVPFKKFQSNNDARRHDHYTFYALMSVSVLSQELLDSFVRAEELLFLYRLRVSGLSVTDISSYFWTDISLRNELILNSTRVKKPDLFCLDFEKAFDFFSPKSVEMKDGFVYLSTDQVYQIVAKMFRLKLLSHIGKQESSISRSTIMLQSMTVEFRERITPKQENTWITLETLDEKANESFPLCMRRIYNLMRQSGVVGFKAQFELALFLKGLGLSESDQTQLWQESGGKNQLNMQAIYGRDGRGRDYIPHSCISMVTKECKKSVYQIQGCPFRCLAKTELKMCLKKIYGSLSRTDMDLIAEQVPEHPQIACRLLFNSLFPDNPLVDTAIEHPVQYFMESQSRFSMC